MTTLTFEPPPTYAEVIIEDPQTHKGHFNPIWLKWFVDITQVLSAAGAGGGGSIQHNTLAGLQGGQANEYFHLTNLAYTFLSGLTTSTGSGAVVLANAPTLSSVTLTGAMTQIASIVTSGLLGTPAIVATGRVTAQTAANASISSFTVGAADASFEVSMNMNVTAATSLATT